jgi:antitoxin ParD1/3/4
MPTRNVNLTGELDRFVAASIESGRYANASEVVRSALRLLEQEERENEEKLAALHKAIQEGDAGAFIDGEEFFLELDAYIGRLAQEKDEKVA